MKWEKPTILVVDDEIQNVRILTEFLKDEFRIVIALDGEQALSRANAMPPPGIILLDIMMPGMDGYEVCRRLKGDNHTADIPVIFMTAMTQPSDEIKGLELGAVDYIGKPYSLPIVRSRIRTHVELKSARFETIQAARFAAAGRLAAGMAHEINTPVQYIGDNIGYISNEIEYLIEISREYVEKCGVDAVRKKFSRLETDLPAALEDLNKGVERIARIVDSAKDFCVPIDSPPHSADLNRLIDNVVTVSSSLWRPLARVEANLDPNLPSVYCHPGRMSEVIISLIQNAMQAVVPERPGIIGISTWVHEGLVEICVSDNGAGIPKPIRDQIFDPFFTTRDVGSGMGLGLSIAYDTITKQGGSISVQDGEDEGTVFIIRLPAAGGETA